MLAPYVRSYSIPTLPVTCTGALDGSVQVFFTELEGVQEPTSTTSAWTYQPARRKARPRSRRSKPLGASSEPLSLTEEAFWTLPPAKAEYGPEVLTTPIPISPKLYGTDERSPQIDQ